MGKRVEEGSKGLSPEEKKRKRESELKKQRKRRKLDRAAFTLFALSWELTGTDSGQDEYYTEFDERGLKQIKGEANDELMERAAGIFRANGYSAEEASEAVINRMERVATFSEEKRMDALSQMSSQVAEVYERLSEKK